MKSSLNIIEIFSFSFRKTFQGFLIGAYLDLGDYEIYNLHVAVSYIRGRLREYTGKRKEKFIHYSQGYYYFDKAVIKNIDCQELEDLYQEGLLLEGKEPEKALEKNIRGSGSL